MVQRIVLMLVCFSLSVAAQTVPAAAPKASPASAAKNPTAVFHTSAGEIKCELFMDKAPKTVSNFIGLATGKKDWTNPASGQAMHNQPLYDGTIFHRVIPNFMIQGGDPLGQGIGGPGYKFEDEFNSSLAFDQPGRLAMANSGPNTNGSQFFITEVPTPHLNGHHTIFGQCDAQSVELVKKIARMPTGPGNRPADPVKITHLEILNMPGAEPAAPKPKGTPAASPKKSPTTSKK
jgi:peptidyl-prolyl cis-trans isomerase A (cyclophilin A)